jgi:hypothetical protein
LEPPGNPARFSNRPDLRAGSDLGFYAVGAPYPNNVYIAGLILASVALGLVVLGLAGTRSERPGRYAFFAFDAAAISAALAFAPLSSGGDVPQNLVFFSSRIEYVYVAPNNYSLFSYSRTVRNSDTLYFLPVRQ